GSPRRLPFGGDDIIYFRTFADYQRLRALTEKRQRFAVIGAGFIGSEIAAALAMNRKDALLIFPGQSIGERIFPRDLSQFVTDFYKQKGVEILAGEAVSGLDRRGNQLAVKLSQREILVDGAVAGVGIEPNDKIAQAAGMKVEDGIVVD